MDTVHRSRRTDIDWLADGPIGPFVDAFKQFLTERRYAGTTSARYLAGITQFARWARSRRLQLRRIHEVTVAKFLDDHLPSCNCAGPARHDRGDQSAALGHLLVVLRAQGAIALPTISTMPVDVELLHYDEYMEHARGLAPKTRDMALRIVGRLLATRFGDGAIDIAAVKPEHVRRFFAQQAELYSKPASAGSVVTSLRGYFRYRASPGDLVHGLIGAVSYPANWALSTLPKTLTAEEVQQLVRSLGQSGRTMRRADAHPHAGWCGSGAADNGCPLCRFRPQVGLAGPPLSRQGNHPIARIRQAFQHVVLGSRKCHRGIHERALIGVGTVGQ